MVTVSVGVMLSTMALIAKSAFLASNINFLPFGKKLIKCDQGMVAYLYLYATLELTELFAVYSAR